MSPHFVPSFRAHCFGKARMWWRWRGRRGKKEEEEECGRQCGEMALPPFSGLCCEFPARMLARKAFLWAPASSVIACARLGYALFLVVKRTRIRPPSPFPIPEWDSHTQGDRGFGGAERFLVSVSFFLLFFCHLRENSSFMFLLSFSLIGVQYVTWTASRLRSFLDFFLGGCQFV